jgi:prepilin-type N-terminal cleavage/methylation domain-containing protein
MTQGLRRILLRGFTLVELLVVIGVIAVLAGLVLAVGSGVLRRTERTMTETALTSLEQAIDELELQRGQALVFNRRKGVGDSDPQDALPFMDVNELPPGFVNEAYIMPRLIALLAANQASAAMLERIPGDLLRAEEKRWPDGAVTRMNLRDAWGEQIAVVPCGRPATRSEIIRAREVLRTGRTSAEADPLAIGIDLEDGTVRTTDEWSLNTGCRGRRWLFISRGPDQSLGMPAWGAGGPATSVSDANRDGQPDWADNLFNYEPGRPER